MVSWSKCNCTTCSTMLFTHFPNSRPISTFTLLFFMLTPTAWNVSKFSWFPSLPSWRRRNFLGKRFTFLATRELLVQLKPGCFALPSAPLLHSVVDQQPVLWEAGQDWSCGLPTVLKSFAELSHNGHALNAHVESLIKGRKLCFPLPGPPNGRKARFLCGWILGSLLEKRSHFMSQQVRQGNCPLTQGGSCQNKHIGDNVSQLVFSLLFLLYLFPTSPIQAFPELHVPAATQRPFQTKTLWRGWMRAHDRPSNNMKHCHRGTQRVSAAV